MTVSDSDPADANDSESRVGRKRRPGKEQEQDRGRCKPQRINDCRFANIAHSPHRTDTCEVKAAQSFSHLDYQCRDQCGAILEELALPAEGNTAIGGGVDVIGKCDRPSADDDDLLKHLDSGWRREQDAFNKRDLSAEIQAWDFKDSPAVSDMTFRTHDDRANCDKTSAEVFLPLWQDCARRLQAVAQSEEDKASPFDDTQEVDCCTSSTDLLKRLDLERKRELNRLSQRRVRARKKLSLHADLKDAAKGAPSRPSQTRWEGGGIDINGDKDDVASHTSVKKGGLSAQRQHRYKARENEKKQAATLSRDSVFDNELSDCERLECKLNLRKALGAQGLDECVCAVCDRLVLRVDARRINDTDWSYMDKMKASLNVMRDDLPCKLLDQYRAPPHLVDLSDVMLSPRGIHSYVDEALAPRAWFSVCEECDRSVIRGKLPKFAIANGFFVGALPSRLCGLTLPERFTTQLVTVAAITRVLRGGRHRCIRSHCIAFDCTPGPPIVLLPRSIQDVASYRVVMVGEFTPAQSTQVRKMHRIRSSHVEEVFSFYKKYNHLYENVLQNESVLRTEITDDGVERTFVERVDDQAGCFESAINAEQENVRGECEAWRVEGERDESTVVERRIGLSDDVVPAITREHSLADTVGVVKERDFEIRRSSKLSNDISGDLFARMFPHLFPFGRGHPGEKRQITVSVDECVKYYTMLSRRQFAEDELFALVAFDRISLRNMFMQNHFRCQRYPHILNGYDALSAEQLGRAILENERRQQGCLPWRPTDDTVAQRFLRTVEIGTRSVWGSNAERAQCRHKAFAYQTRFGQPALFVTLTPNTDNSLVLAHYAGVSSVESLFDLLDARLPSKAEMREASLRNDCASARLFMRQVDAFIRYALGIDPVSRKRLAFRGLFGDVKAYFGMVESQGRGTLHVHFLIWLNNCPPNSAAIEKILHSADADEFRERVTSYANSIVTNDIPLSVEECECSECGAEFSKLVGLPIRESARKNPQAGIRSARVRAEVSEPALIECSVCKTKCSSQHLLRNALLKFRPAQWPPWKRSLTEREIYKQAATEAICRNSKKQAVNIVDEREKLHASLSGTDAIKYCADQATELLHQTNGRQMRYHKNDDDPFRNDSLTRLFEVSPPSVADDRISVADEGYMVSALAILLNQHLWSHTSSCFKQSRVTTNDSFCRYRFPRERVESTTFGGAGVQMRRKLGHEYMNGFNFEIMATFRCNHDIQVLLGGNDAADRIYYCCKYITKQQKRLDSQVAVAVAALKRRQDREAVEMSITGGDSTITARKRVAAMVYNMTNRQEVAGPLAALYLYRESCCYASGRCATLSLGDAIRQLTTSDEYACVLVNESNASEAASFRAVSSLDDYLFRPSGLEHVNLYEFTMWYFRKKSDNATISRLSFLAGHPLRGTHALGKRYEEVIPVIQGFRMPFTGCDSSQEKMCKRAVIALVLFKPFRGLCDLVGVSEASDQEAWLLAFDSWKGSCSKFSQTILNNMDDYYNGAEKAKQRSAEMEAMGIAIEGDASDEENPTGKDTNEGFCDGDCDYIDDDMEFSPENESLSSLWDTEENDNVIMESSALDPSACPTSAPAESRIASMLLLFRQHNILDGVAQTTASAAPIEWCPEEIPSVDFMKRWVKDNTTDNSLVPSTVIQVAIRDTEVVELLDNSLLESNMSWHHVSSFSSRPPTMPKTFASIREISQEFTLNQRQHCAFKLIGNALLSRWRNAENLDGTDGTFDSVLSKNQLLCFLGGEGGTGKSRIVDAVQMLCQSWSRSGSVVKTAMTGKAATLIGGRTLASFLLQIKKKAAKDAVMNLDLIIVDEVSMMKRFQLSQLDKRLRIGKHVPGVAFGGVHVVLVGDFLQLPPVRGSPLYRDPTGREQTSADEIAGYHLWREFTDVIILKESVRFRKDPEWGIGCQQARLGVWTPEFVALINSRVLASDALLREPLTKRNFSTFVTPDNKTRMSLNSLFISTVSKMLRPDEYPVRVVANFKGKLAALNHSEVREIMAMPDTKFGRMAPYLDLIIGMPIQVTQNVRAEKMVANGTLGRLESIIYHPGTIFRLVHDTIADITVKVPSVPPPVILVRVDRGSTATSIQGCSDSDIFPLFFDSRAYNPCDIALPGTIRGIPRALKVQVEQFPMVCAVASTVYKVQGETLEGMVVTEWKSKTALANKREQPYLMVSRVTSRAAFATLTPLTNEITTWAHPSPEALEEEERLDRLSTETIARL